MQQKSSFLRQILFQLDTLENLCEEHILENFGVEESFADLRRVGERLNRVKMIEKADAYILKNFLQIRDSDEFIGLSLECLKKVLSSSELKVKKEEEVLESILKWTEKNGSREPELKELLRCVRVNQLESGGLCNVAMENRAMGQGLAEVRRAMAREMEPDDSGRLADEREAQLPRKSAAHGMLMHAGGLQRGVSGKVSRSCLL